MNPNEGEKLDFRSGETDYGEHRAGPSKSATALDIQAWLISHLSELIGVDPEKIDSQKPFAAYGLASKDAIGISGDLEEWLGQELSPTLVYNYPTIETLSRHLAAEAVPLDLTSEEGAKQSIEAEPIAIIGIGCRFPGANDPNSFWQLLHEGRDAITEVPLQRWDLNRFFDPNPAIPGKMSTRWGGFLEQVDQFDAGFFGIAPREAERMDPQQRLLLEVAWEALEEGGIAPQRLRQTMTGVFIGFSTNDYRALQLSDPLLIDAYAGTGNAGSIAANRLSYFLDLRGPSMAVDTACSSSLVAVHLACQSLRSGESDLVLAGGVNLILTPELTIAFSHARMMAADGRCKTFDIDADGYVRGEGCGIVVMKLLSDALSDGDHIWALLRGTAVNQDGRSNGLTAPNGPAQEAVIRKALQNAKVTPAQISYVETHGTGTPLGDPIEVESLKAVLVQDRRQDQPFALGSVKSNIGHLEAAAGIASFIKVVLSLKHEEIPQLLHFKKLNPHISLEGTTISIPTERQPWPAGEERRLAGLSSFGFGGTNAHAILEEAPTIAWTTNDVERRQHVLTLSAHSENALRALAERFEAFLINTSNESLADICYTANAGRAHFAHRLAVVVESVEGARESLRAFIAGQHTAAVQSGHVDGASRPKVAFLFTGQGSQYIGMGRQLYDSQPAFRKALERCNELLSAYLEQPLLSVLYPEDGASTPLDETAYTQPALFALEYALAELWRSWGVEPSVVLGHSVGEYVAACVAGVFSLEDGLKLVAERGRLMQALPQGGEMAAVFAAEERVAAAIADYGAEVSIAAVNGPANVVISGKGETVQAVVRELEGEGISVQQLRVSHAFHSPLMEPVLDEFERVAAAVNFEAPHLSLISNVTGQVISNGEVTKAEYWRRHVREAVQFAAGIKTLSEQGTELFLEIGPSATLLALGQGCVPEAAEQQWLPSLRRGRGEWQQMLESLAALYVRGVKVDWVGFDRDYKRRKVALPTYPFQRQRYWIEAAASGEQTTERDTSNWLYEVEWQVKPRVEPGSIQEIEENEQGSWLIFADQGGVGTALAKLLEERGERCVLVFAGDGYESSENGYLRINPAHSEDVQRLFSEVLETNRQSCRGVVHLWSLDAAPVEETTVSSLKADQVLGCGSVLHLVQALVKIGWSESPRLLLITRGAQWVSSEATPMSVAQAPLWGLGRVIALEHPELHCLRVDLDPSGDPDEIKALFEEIYSKGQEDQIAFRRRVRHVLRLVRSFSKTRAQEDLIPKTTFKSLEPFHPDGTYLITGGFGVLGLDVARWMLRHGARHLVLVGRSGATNIAQESLGELEQMGAQIRAVQADVSQKEQVARLLAEMSGFMPPLRGVIHAAGVLDDGVLLRQDWDRFTRVMSPKVEGAWNLHTLTEELPLDFFVLFSSMASLLGSAGQGNYAAANAFLDALAHHRRGKGLPAVSINWGPWLSARNTSSSSSYDHRRWVASGIGTIATNDGLQILGRIIKKAPSAQLGVLSVEWDRLAKEVPTVGELPFLSKLVHQGEPLVKTGELSKQQSEILMRLKEASPSERLNILVAHIQGEVAKVLGMDRHHPLDPQQKLFEMGMDSLMALELKNRIQAELGCSLPSTLVFNYPTVQSIADYLAKDVLSFELPNTKSSAELQRNNDDLVGASAELDNLSEDELAALVDGEVENILNH